MFGLSSSQLTAAAGGVLAILVGLVDVETTARLGAEWDRTLISLGLGLLTGGAAAPLAGRVVNALRGRGGG